MEVSALPRMTAWPCSPLSIDLSREHSHTRIGFSTLSLKLSVYFFFFLRLHQLSVNIYESSSLVANNFS